MIWGADLVGFPFIVLSVGSNLVPATQDAMSFADVYAESDTHLFSRSVSIGMTSGGKTQPTEVAFRFARMPSGPFCEKAIRLDFLVWNGERNFRGAFEPAQCEAARTGDSPREKVVKQLQAVMRGDRLRQVTDIAFDGKFELVSETGITVKTY